MEARRRSNGSGTNGRLGGIKVLVLAALALSPAAAGAAPAAQTGDDVSSLAALRGEQFEIDFMNMMIQHHSMAVEMANDVVQRGQHQELKDAAQNIIRDQNREIEEMKGWLQQWFNAQYQPGMMHDTKAAQDMSMMHGLSGDELDKMFLSSMRVHHLGAIEMAKLVPDRAVHDELKQMAQNVITSQSEEISKFESWAMAWYNMDISAASPGGTMGGTTGGAMGGEQMGQPGMPRTGGTDGFGLVALSLLALLGATALVAGGVWVRRRA